MATKVTTLKNAEKTDNLLPRTELKAVFDSDGNYLDNGLKASDLNALKGGTVDELVRFTEDGAGTPVPIDADTLEGHDASYFATADALSSLSGTVASMSNNIYGSFYGAKSMESGGNVVDVPTTNVPIGVYLVLWDASSNISAQSIISGGLGSGGGATTLISTNTIMGTMENGGGISGFQIIRVTTANPTLKFGTYRYYNASYNMRFYATLIKLIGIS